MAILATKLELTEALFIIKYSGTVTLRVDLPGAAAAGCRLSKIQNIKVSTDDRMVHF